MRGARVVALAALLGACKTSEPEREQPPAPEPGQEPAPAEDPDAARKRACVERVTAGVEPRFHTLLRSACAEHVELDVPGLALAIVEPGRAPVHVELGVRCFSQTDPVEADTRFRVGSISKTVTAAVAVGLVVEGELALTSEATLIPGFTSQAGLPPPRLDALLRHRSGLGEIEPERLVELDGAWLAALARSPAAGVPGEYHYSNAGYSLVGAMVEAASGLPYAALVEARVAGPLELASLTADPRAANTACGHLEYDRDRHPIPVAEDLEFMPGDPSWMNPAGGLLSSATDLASFALALGDERLPGTAAMLEPGQPLPPDRARADHGTQRYGQGLRSWVVPNGTQLYGHSGNNVSFSAELRLVPGRGAIVILANCGVELPATVAAAEQLLAAPLPAPGERGL